MAAETFDSKARPEAGTETQKGNGVDPKKNNFGTHNEIVNFAKK